MQLMLNLILIAIAGLPSLCGWRLDVWVVRGCGGGGLVWREEFVGCVQRSDSLGVSGDTVIELLAS